jgi:voltage-gated potassium channel
MSESTSRMVETASAQHAQTPHAVEDTVRERAGAADTLDEAAAASPALRSSPLDRLFDPHTRAGLAVEYFTLLLVLLSALSVGVETLPDLPKWATRVFLIEETTVVGVFTVEYLLRIAAARRKLAYVLSFYGLIDLISILPYYVSGLDMRALRAFRLLRLLRVLKFARYSAASARLLRAFRDIRAELTLFLATTGIMIYLCAIAIFHFEHAAQPAKFRSVLDGMWWAATTLTTVNFGDVVPITVGGKIFTAIVLLCGVGIVAVPTGLVAAALTKFRSSSDNGAGPDR